MGNLSTITNENLTDGAPVKVETIFQAYDPNELEEQKIVKENESHIFTPEFIPYYPDIAIRFGLSHMETLIYGFIRFYMKNASKRFYFTNEQLASIMNCSSNTINISISNLTKKGLIVKGHRIKGGGGTIRFISKVEVPENLSFEYKKTDTHHIRKLITNNNKINNNKINNIYMSENQKNKKEVKDESNLGFIKEFGSKRKLEDLSPFLEKFNEITGKHFRKLDKKTTAQINELIKEKYSLEDWSAVIKIAMKDKYITGDNPGGVYYLTPEFISRSNKFEKYMNSKKEFKKQVKPIDDYALKTNKSFVDDLKKKYLEDRDSLSDGQKEFVEKYMDKNKF